ncbi:B12-binding domain-containing radical SAM protein [Candidatus Woesearchaeota archaeon]|nr:B12-binding domain-containing radical SAM protein [Candidatus Woesearchaeota archaeon]
MRILLINPSQRELYGSVASPDYPPVGLGYIAAVLEKDHEVKIIDIDADKYTKESFTRLLTEFQPKLVGITATTPTFKNAVKLSRVIKQHTDAYVALGGIHPNVAHAESIKPESVDFVIVGEGELTMTELANLIANNKNDYTKIDGLVFKHNSRPMFNKQRELIKNLDTLPNPARHLFRQNNYTDPDATAQPTIPIITSRGCPGNCTYCCTKQIFSTRFRYRSAKNVAEEIEYLVKGYGAKEIHIWDDMATLVKKRIFDLRDELKQRDIKVKIAFPNGLRVDYFNEEIGLALKEMGTYSIAFGVESGNQKILDKARKEITLDQVREAFRIAKKLKLETWGFFMLGLIGETESTVHDTIEFAKELDPDVVKFHILVPYPGTPVYNELLSKGFILSKDYSKYGIHTKPVHRLENLTPEDMLRLQKQAYREFYLRPRIIIKQLLRINSFTRLKLNMRAGVSIFRSMIS